MNDVEDALESNSITEDEDEYEFTAFDKNKLRDQFSAVKRQFYCFCGVMMFPIFSQMTADQKSLDLCADNKIPAADRANLYQIKAIYINKDTMFLPIGLICGGVLLRYIGRKRTVLAANILNFMVLLHLYSTGVKELPRHGITLLHYIISQASFVAYFIYVAEITSPTNRAFFMALFWFYEILIQGPVATAQEQNAMNHMFLFGTVAATLSSVIAFFIPETPFWLTVKGDPEKAEETFKWLRAGDSDAAEFDLMIATAKSFIELRNLQPVRKLYTLILTPTFAIAVVFSISLVMGSFNPCHLINAVIYSQHLYYIKVREGGMFPLDNEFDAMKAVMNAGRRENGFFFSFYGQLIFLLFNFLFSRRTLFTASYILGVLIAIPLSMMIVLIHFEKFLIILSACSQLVPYVGVYSLSQILPTEIYPIALREIGVILTAILSQAQTDIFVNSQNEKEPGFPRTWQYNEFVYPNFFASLVFVLLLIVFMPETKDINIYELEKLELMPFWKQSNGNVDENEDDWDEEPVLGDESIAEAST